MTQWHLKADRKASGGIRTTMRRSDKRLLWKGGIPAMTTIAESVEGVFRKSVKCLGSGTKVKARSEKNVVVNTGGKVRVMEILTVLENKADRQFSRNNIITKGAVLKAKDASGEASVKVTNRPGQQGTIQGIILDNFVKEKDLKAKDAGKSEKKVKKIKKMHKGRATPSKEEKKQ